MNRSELVNAIAEQTGATKTLTDTMLTAFMDTVTNNIRSKDGVRLVGFGTFKTTKRKARTARNPQTGEEIKVPARLAPVFKAGSELKEAVSGKSR